MLSQGPYRTIAVLLAVKHDVSDAQGLKRRRRGRLSDRGWIVAAAIIVGVELATATAVWALTGYSGLPSVGFHVIFVSAFGFLSLGVLFIVGLAKLMWQRADRPTYRLASAAWALRWRALATFAGLQILALHFVAFNWAKAMLPLVVPFWLDKSLASFDAALFGEQAWSWAHAVAGPFTDPIRWLYMLWLPVQLIAAALVLHVRPSTKKTEVATAYFMTWLIGGVLSYPLSSAGPLFYERLGLGGEFNALLFQDYLGNVRQVADYLWSSHVHRDVGLGVGISAMPSMHVAIATWIMIAAHAFARPLLGASVIFFAAIFFGSFLLGWHYFLDAPGGVACACVGWLVAKRVARASSSSRPPSSLVPADSKKA